MAKLHFEGYVEKGYTGMPILKNGSNQIKLVHEIKEQLIQTQNIGTNWEIEMNQVFPVGGECHKIPNCFIQIWFTKNKTTLKKAKTSVVSFLVGDYLTTIKYGAYSKLFGFTITDYYLNDFCIGKHDLKQLFESHLGSYCHFIISAYTPIKGLTCSKRNTAKPYIKFPNGNELEAVQMIEILYHLEEKDSIVITNDDLLTFLFKEKLIEYDDECIPFVIAKQNKVKDLVKFRQDLEEMVFE